ncbi:MAG: type II toxin-antitoxin system PemK/MazF family toxin [Alphaproteobacteria bacterium]|nr:type II toxin-antitoxin system PemK/MazF family toxin [Alphaproteobacteria bacterium]
MGVVTHLRRFDLYLVNLDPTQGSEIKKIRPCIIISPDDMNRHLRTTIIAPMTSKIRQYPTRVFLEFNGKEGQIALDQLRTVDQERLIKKLGTISKESQATILHILHEIFSE